MAIADPNARALPGATFNVLPDLMPLIQRGRAAVENAVEVLLQHLDALDGDPDLEADPDGCDFEDDGPMVAALTASYRLEVRHG